MKPFRRHLVIAALGAPALLLSRRAAAARQRLTPAQTEGPFYPVALPADSDADLLANGALRYARGQAAWVEGTLTDADGRALAGAAVEIWQCDGDGHYHHPGDGDRADRAFQGFGRATVDRDGRWRFRTIRPVAYSGRTPHIHTKVKLGGRELLTTQLYVQGDPNNERDFLWRRLNAEDRAALTAPFVQGADGLKASYTLVVVA
jgi:protocatechuate 3,4-dioxygenase beta subunit